MKKTIFFLLLAALPASLMGLSLEGAHRTERSHLERLWELCLSQSVPRPEALKACLMESELFASVRVRRQGGQWAVEVVERWSLLPVPVVVAEPGRETKAGLFLAERNFLGRGALLLAGGSASNSTAAGLLRYEDRHFLAPRGYIQVTAAYARRQIYLYADRDETLDGRDETRRSVELHWGAGLGAYYLLALTATARELSYRTYKHYARPEPVSLRWLGLMAEYDRTAYRFYFDAGPKAELQWRFEERTGAGLAKLDLGWQGLLHQRQALQLRLQADYGTSDSKALAVQGGGALGARGVPAYGLWSTRYATASIDYQVPIVYTRWGVATIAPFVDLGRIDLAGSDRRVDYAAFGAGAYFFLKRVSLPGLGVILGHNDPYAERFVKVFLGFDL